MSLRVHVKNRRAHVWVPPGEYTAEELARILVYIAPSSVELVTDDVAPTKSWMFEAYGFEELPQDRSLFWWVLGALLVALLLLAALLLTSCGHAPVGMQSPALTSVVAPAVGGVSKDRHHGGNRP